MEVLVPSTPKRLKVTQTMAEDFLCDPVLGVKVIFGVALDAFQKSALRTMWWVPDVIHTSGFGTGKSFLDWLWANLRNTIIPDQWGWVYYQTYETGKQVFWPYYDQFNARTAPIFAAQLGKLDEFGDTDGKDNRRGAAASIQHWKNGNKLVLPAPGWLGSAATQAGLTFNWTLVDEWTKIETMKSNVDKAAEKVGGIDQQVIGRVRRQSFNQFHPLWCNHRKFSATAESPQHPASKRYKMFEREIAKGNPNYAIIRYDFKDFSNLKSWTGKPFKEQVPDWKTIKHHKAMFTRAHSLREDHGIWARETAGWYAEEMLNRCVEAGIAHGTEVETQRWESLGSARHEAPIDTKQVFYFLGVDPAPAKSKTADDGAIAAVRARPRPDLGGPPTNNPSDWLCEAVYAYRVRGETKRNLGEQVFLAKTTRQWSGIIHWKHQLFGFSGICLDPQSGGAGGLIASDLAESKQIILGNEMDVLPIASLDDDNAGHAEFILCYFKRSDSGVSAMWPLLRGDDNLNDAMHMIAQQALDHAMILFPKPFNERPGEETRNWPAEKQWALKNLDAARHQLQNIQVETKDDGTWVMTGNDAKKFVCAGKKDLAYALLMGYVRFRVWLKRSEIELGDAGGESGIYVMG